jgi:hypothetical protein
MTTNFVNQTLYNEIESNIPALHSFVKGVAEHFGLGFDKSDYNYLFVSSEQKTLLDFLGGCPAPPHDKWDVENRSQYVHEFIESSDFIEYVKGLTFGGNAMMSGVRHTLRKLPDCSDYPDWVNDLKDRFDSQENNVDTPTALLFTSDGFSVSSKRLEILLIHEWMHLLFFKNSIEFQKVYPSEKDIWLYDEGLATWVEGRFATGRWDIGNILLNQVKRYIEDGAPVSVWGYYAMAYWFSEHFNKVSESEWATHLQELMSQQTLKSIQTICTDIKEMALA